MSWRWPRNKWPGYATAADRDMGLLSADDLRMDAQWLKAALAGRDGYVAALGELLRTMPALSPASAWPVQFAQQKITTTLPSVPAPAGARAVRGRRP